MGAFVCYSFARIREFSRLGTYPDVPIDRARARHRFARRLLAAGVDPSLRRRELRQIVDGAASEAFELPSEWQQTG